VLTSLFLNRLRWFAALLLALMLAAPALAQQPGPVQYVYDALGRLVRVIDGQGNVAGYVYDAVGNILEIRRSSVSGLALFNFTPQQVQLLGSSLFSNKSARSEDWQPWLQGKTGTCYVATREKAMLQHSQRHYSEDDYFAVEVSSGVKHEFYRGEILAMAGASLTHNHLSANVLTALRGAVRPKGCSAFGSDLRVKTPDGLFTYPDVMVVCGPISLAQDRPDTVTNPWVIVEVLSDATRDYDRGEKFTLYQAIPTLQEYFLIEQDRVCVEHWQRQPTEDWTAQTHTSLNAVISLPTLGMTLLLREVYLQVFDS
jgi:YD repeat-containing protein